MSHERRNPAESASVLVIDDEPDIRELLDITLSQMGLSALCVGTLAEAKKALASKKFGLCLTDMRLPDGSGLEIVQLISEKHPTLPVAAITAYGSAESAVSVLKAGAFDYISKPVSLDNLRSLVKSALRLSDDPPTKSTGELVGLIGDSSPMAQVRDTIKKLSRSQAPIYISGESGSGKELAARLIHRESARKDAPFIPVNCGAIPENLMESEFFGYRKGAFTGADNDRNGFFQAADGGTLFLDEVADLPLLMQVKLLRAIQEKRVRKVGQSTEENVDIRIISATHKNLRDNVEKGMFRQDLYYRLNVIELKMPSLRERPEDILLLSHKILQRLFGQNAPALSKQAQNALVRYSFPGNVRELENILERAVALSSSSSLEASDLHLEPESRVKEAASGETRGNESLDDYLGRLERAALVKALEVADGNRTKAARKLGITFRSMRYRLLRHGLD